MRKAFDAIRSDFLALGGFCFLLVVAILAIGADFLAPFDPVSQSLRLRNMPPWTPSEASGLLDRHLLGTDPLGRDLLSRMIHGARVSLSVGVASVIVSGSIGVGLGVLAGYSRGWVDDLIMRITDIVLGLPALLLVLLILFFFGSGMVQLVVVFGLIRWPVYARVTRGMTMSMREQPFIEGAKAIGATNTRIIFRHILPNLAAPILTLAALEMAVVILAEAGLSFLGLGLQPPTPSWGLIVASGRSYIEQAWWIITFSGAIILMTTLSLNLVATALRRSANPLEHESGAGSDVQRTVE